MERTGGEPDVHINLGRGMFAGAPRYLFSQHAALSAVDPPHAGDQEDQITPEADELKAARRARLVVAGRGLMTARAYGSRSFPWPDRDEDGLPVFVEGGLPVDKSWDGMALVEDSGKAHECLEVE